MLGFESGSYFICTETSPRCFILQQMSNVDDSVRNAKSHSPASRRDQHHQPQQPQQAKHPEQSPAPQQQQVAPSMMLPWWFTAECRQQLLSIPSFETLAQHAGGASYASISRSATPEQMSMEQLRSRLKHQLEYYFSRENLINDRYLRCQMDADQYVSIKIVAGFPKVAQLTNDYDLIVDVLRSSSNVQVDDAGKKVRPVTKRCTIILREIPESATENDVKAMFDGCAKKFVSIAYGLNNSWYVTFEDEEATKLAFMHLKDLAFNNKPIHARIKTGNAPGNPNPTTSTPDYGNFAPCVTPVPPAEKGDVLSTTNLGQIIVHDISHHYHNHSLQNHVQQQQQQSGRYLPIEVDTSLPSFANTAQHGLSPNSVSGGGGAGGYRLAPTPGAGKPEGNGQLPSSLNLGLLLAQYGYVPRATFRPHVPIPGVVVSAPTPTPTPLRPASTVASAADGATGGRDPANDRKVEPCPDEDKENVLAAKKKRLNSETTPAPPPPPDFGRQRITDVPRLNKDRCSPLMNGKPTANFLAGMSLVASEMFARAATGGKLGGRASESAPLAFTDGTNMNAIIDPIALLSGPQLFGDVITVSVDERQSMAGSGGDFVPAGAGGAADASDPAAPTVNGVGSAEKPPSSLQPGHTARRNSRFSLINGNVGDQLLLCTNDAESVSARTPGKYRNRFSEGDENNFHSVKNNSNSNRYNNLTFYDNFSGGQHFVNSKYSNGVKSGRGPTGGNENERSSWFHNYYNSFDQPGKAGGASEGGGCRAAGAPRIRRSTINASASFEDKGATCATNALFGGSGELLPLSQQKLPTAPLRRLEFRSSSHYANTFYNSALAQTAAPSAPAPTRYHQKRASLTSRDERPLTGASSSYAYATAANGRPAATANHVGSAENGVAAGGSAQNFSLADVEFPQLMANGKWRGGVASGSGGEEAVRRRHTAGAAARVQFSAVVAGVHPHDSSGGKVQDAAPLLGNGGGSNDEGGSGSRGVEGGVPEKCSYAQTLKKVHR